VTDAAASGDFEMCLGFGAAGRVALRERGQLWFVAEVKALGHFVEILARKPIAEFPAGAPFPPVVQAVRFLPRSAQARA
jgi:hypothetical protein